MALFNHCLNLQKDLPLLLQKLIGSCTKDVKKLFKRRFGGIVADDGYKEEITRGIDSMEKAMQILDEKGTATGFRCRDGRLRLYAYGGGRSRACFGYFKAGAFLQRFPQKDFCRH